MPYDSFAPLRAAERQWLIDAEIVSGPIPARTRIAVCAPTSAIALERACDRIGAQLQADRIIGAELATLDEEIELLGKLDGTVTAVWSRPRPSRVSDAGVSGGLEFRSGPPPKADATGLAVLPDAMRNPDGAVFAVLDGAAIFGLVEQLEGSGLAWKCLFQGDAARRYAAAAPYLVEMRPDNALTQKMLRPSLAQEAGRPSALQSGIFLSSPVSLEGLWRHLRKFTMLEDTGRRERVYFRFFDPLIFRTLVVNLAPSDLATFCTGTSAMAAVSAEGGFAMILRQERAS